jgi:hypothetical protein
VLLSLANDFPKGRSDSFYRELSADAALAGQQAPGRQPDGRGSGAFGQASRAARHPEWAGQVAAEASELRAAIKSAHQAPLRFLIWAGVGGSAEDKWMFQAAGLLKRGPRCYVLDSADPAKLRAILEDIERRYGLTVSAALRGTLVVGMTAGGGSRETVLNIEKLANLYERHRVDGRAHFLCLAAEGSALDALARERGYRREGLELDGGGRTAGYHCGPLTRGSLYPLALARADLAAWIQGACLGEKDINTAWRLASFLHTQAEAGRDKVTLLLPKHWAGAAVWTKRAFEECLGRSEAPGLKVIPCTKPRLANYRAPKHRDQDRTFLAVRVSGMPGPDPAKIGLLRRSGYPMAVLTLPHGASLSRYMQFLHHAVFGTARLGGMDSASAHGAEAQQSISEGIFAEAEEAGGAKRTACWKRMASSPRQAAFRSELTLHYDRLNPDFEPGGMDAPQLYAAILGRLAADRSIEYGELTFFGDTRYSPAGIAARRILDHAAEGLFERRLNMPADVAEGPAASHSGRRLSTVLLPEKQEQLAQARYAPDYHVAQFLAAQVALAERGRPVVAITLRDLEEASLRALEEFFHRAATYLKPGRF